MCRNINNGETESLPKQLASAFGMKEPIEDLLMAYRLRWLGHLGRMGEERLATGEEQTMSWDEEEVAGWSQI